MKFRSLVAAATVLATSSVVGLSANATTLSGSLTADNEFWAYISTDNTQLGALIGSGNNWPSASAITAQSLIASTYYIHIVAQNENFNLDGAVVPADPAGGNPDALLGQFHLSDSAYHFANGLQDLTTDTVNWQAIDTSAPPSWVTAPIGTPVSYGTNGGPNIWTSANGGPISGIGTQAEWIWASVDPNTGLAFFSTEISSAVPEASTWLMLIVGFAGVGFASYRKKTSGPALRMA